MSVTIGILGGMGPRATVQFEQKLLDSLEGSDQSLPTIISINDGNIPDRSQYLLAQGEDPLPQLLRRAKQLEMMGADLIVMPCNSACAPQIICRLQSCTIIPILNLPQLTGAAIKSNGATHPMIFATLGTIKAGTYQSILENLGLDLMVPEPTIQLIITQLITAIKSNSTSTLHLINTLRQYLRDSRCDSVILGCTELPLAPMLVPSDMPVFDTIEILIQATVEYTNTKEKHYVTR